MTELDQTRPIAVDLFAGAGGLSLGFEQAGFDIAVAVEYDPIHAAIHELNFPYGAVICRDVRKVTGQMIRERGRLENSEIDAVIGGPPCQGFSLIGHRVLDDSRNELVFHFLRLVDELRPRTFIMENVPGMATGRHNQLLDELIERFQAIGYNVQIPYRILNAAEYGVPQARRRLFLLGSRDGVTLPRYPDTTTVPRPNGKITINGSPPSASNLPLCPSVQDAIGDLPNIDDFEALFKTDILHYRPHGGSLYARRLQGDLRDEKDYSHQRKYHHEVLTGCLRARHTELSRTRFAATQGGKTEPVSRFYRLAFDGVSNTLRAGTASDRGAFSAPRPIHPLYPRCISVREAARLHSFPDWFRFHRTIWHGFRQIGNSVPPLLARAVASEVLLSIKRQPRPSNLTFHLGPDHLAAFSMKEAAEYFGVPHDVIPQRKRAGRANTTQTVLN